MRFLILILINFGAMTAWGTNITTGDSLRMALKSSTPREKVDIYRNLADVYYRLPQEESYLKLTSDYAEKFDLTDIRLEALSDLVILKINDKQIDSAKYYIDKISNTAPHDQLDKWVNYLSMYLFNYIIYEDPKESVGAVNDKLSSIKAGGKNDVYSQMEQAYIIASSIYVQKKYDDVWPYINTLERLASTLPFKDGCRYRLLALRMQSRLLSREQKYTDAIDMVEEVIRVKERYVDQYYKGTRPYYPMDEFYISNYTTLMLNVKALPKEKSDYYISRLIKLSEKTTIPSDKYNCFLSLNNYYLNGKDWNKALQANDSLIKYAHIIAPYNLSGLHRMSSFIYENLGLTNEALTSFKVAYKTQDSISTLETNRQLNELQVEYDLNKLNYDKSQLEIKNKMMLITGLLIVLLLFVIICAYLYRNLKRERHMKSRLRSLMLRAEESERMKSEFINSICHEIRTPLNAISGFSSLICDPSVDEETKLCFPEEIERNTKILTSLINSMLEVSLLDVSDEKLPCEPTDISQICHIQIDVASEMMQEGVLSSVELSCEPMIIPTNEHYLSLVLDNLISNACKFTNNGSIIVKCELKEKLFIMSVTDTGSGIPEDMHKAIFDRFTKLDSYKQGNGLGLYLCKLVVSRLLGRIYVDSSYKHGTRMIVELPLE